MKKKLTVTLYLWQRLKGIIKKVYHQKCQNATAGQRNQEVCGRVQMDKVSSH